MLKKIWKLDSVTTNDNFLNNIYGIFSGYIRFMIMTYCQSFGEKFGTLYKIWVSILFFISMAWCSLWTDIYRKYHVSQNYVSQGQIDYKDYLNETD